MRVMLRRGEKEWMAADECWQMRLRRCARVGGEKMAGSWRF